MLLADTGRSAFLEAERQMEVLRGNSRYIFSETGPVRLENSYLVIICLVTDTSD